MRTLALALVLAAGCTKAPPPNETSTNDKGKQGYSPQPAPAKATVTLTSVTLADNCGGEPPFEAPLPSKKFAQPPAAGAVPADVGMRSQRPGLVAERRRCLQTSMQLEIDAASAADVVIRSVEVFDEKGTMLGSLASSKPRQWSATAGAYEDWNEKLAAGQLAQVTYVLEQATFVSNFGYQARTFTVKVLASVGGVEQPLQTTVMIVAQPPAMPT